jgi:hypothetical protein
LEERRTLDPDAWRFEPSPRSCGSVSWAAPLAAKEPYWRLPMKTPSWLGRALMTQPTGAHGLGSKASLEHHVERRLGYAAELAEPCARDDFTDARLAGLRPERQAHRL